MDKLFSVDFDGTTVSIHGTIYNNSTIVLDTDKYDAVLWLVTEDDANSITSDEFKDVNVLVVREEDARLARQNSIIKQMYP